VVDYHSITQKFVTKEIPEYDPKDQIGLTTSVLNSIDRVEELTLKTAATLLACGINPELSTLFVQSQVPAHCEMMWLLSSITPLSWLNKMIQFKEKKAASDKHSSLSLYSYPVLMAADIMLY
jgi:tryptophanyl-tRNA synthetase